MGKLFSRYSLVFYVVVTLSMVYYLSPIVAFDQQLNVFLIGVGLLLGFTRSHVIFSNQSFYTFSIIWSYLLINVLYQLTFGWLTFRAEDFLYLLAKASFIFILISSIASSPIFYFKKYYYYVGLLTVILLAYGFFFSERVTAGRLFLGFSNPNSAGAVAALGAGVFLLHPEFKGIKKWIGVLILFIAVVFTGSRSALVISIIGMMFLGLTLKNYIFGGIFLVLLLFLIPQLGFEAVGINRLVESLDSKDAIIATNREGEFEAGYLMFKHKFWEGYGLTGYKIVDKSILPSYLKYALGTHNGYLAAAKMYGVIFWVAFIITILIRPLLLIKSLIKINNKYLKVHLFVVSAVLVGALAEDYIVGINSIVTTLFFSSLAMLEMYHKLYISENQYALSKISTL